MNTRTVTTAMIALSVSLAACGGAGSTAEPEVSVTASPAVTTEAVSTADETTVADTAAPATTTAPTTTPATTDALEATTTAPSSDESVNDELELVSVRRISLGAGSGEYDILVDQSPDGLERFKVSTSGVDGYCNAQILDTQSTADGVVITVLPDCGGTTFGVAWVHVDGRRSDIAYRDCSAGITYDTAC